MAVFALSPLSSLLSGRTPSPFVEASRTPSPFVEASSCCAQSFVASSLVCASLISQPANAATIQEASISFADATYPIVKSLKARQVSPLATKLTGLAITGNPTEIIKTIDTGLDAFLSVPPERFFAAARALKVGSAQAAAVQKCELVCLPPIDTVERFASAAGDALSVADPLKLKQFVFQAIRSLQSGDRAQYADVVAEAQRFATTVDPASLAAAKRAGFDILVASTDTEDLSAGFVPAGAAAPRNPAIEAASTRLADALYPLVRSLQARAVAPLAQKVVGLAVTGSPTEIIRTVDRGLDAFVTVPPDKFFAAAKALKAATASASGVRDCGLVCLPPLAQVEAVASAAADALSVSEPTKLQAFVVQAARSLQSGDKLLLAGALAEGGKFASTLSPTDVKASAAAGLELLKATGAPANVSQAATGALELLTKATGG